MSFFLAFHGSILPLLLPSSSSLASRSSLSQLHQLTMIFNWKRPLKLVVTNLMRKQIREFPEVKLSVSNWMFQKLSKRQRARILVPSQRHGLKTSVSHSRGSNDFKKHLYLRRLLSVQVSSKYNWLLQLLLLLLQRRQQAERDKRLWCKWSSRLLSAVRSLSPVYQLQCALGLRCKNMSAERWCGTFFWHEKFDVDMLSWRRPTSSAAYNGSHMWAVGQIIRETGFTWSAAIKHQSEY